MIGDLAQSAPVMATGCFDPAAWLDRFQEVGGWWAISDDRLWFGWRVGDDDQIMAARATYRDVERQPDRLVSVRRLIEKGREPG